MAFNPFISFQKNRRFWMAAILMICMVSFVFCTGMRGDISDRLPYWFGFGKSGATAFTIDGRSVGKRELDDLRVQRNFANVYMKNCAEIAYKNATKRFYEMSKNVDDKEEQKRKEVLFHLVKIKSTLFVRKNKPRYFDSGVKFDDMIEFKLWQAEADRLGIRLEDNHVQILFDTEFFGILSSEDIARAQFEARNEFRDASDAYVRRAVGEEFRVRIAQYALLGHQPSGFMVRRKAEQHIPKYFFPDFPDELRAPLTLGQVYSTYKTQCADFSVSLVPVRVQDFLDKIKAPDEIQKEGYFNATKSDPFDPSSDKWGPEIPPRARFEYLIADPMSPQYLDRAKLMTQMKRSSPIAVSLLRSQQMNSDVALHAAKFCEAAFDLIQPPVAVASRQAVLALEYSQTLSGHYKAEVIGDRFRTSARYSEKDVATPILTHFAARHPHAEIGLIASAFAAPESAIAGYVAWGTIKYPLQGDGTEVIGKDEAKTKTKVFTKLNANVAERATGKDTRELFAVGELADALQSEADRRAATFVQSFLGITGESPLEVLFPVLYPDRAIDTRKLFEDETQRLTELGRKTPLGIPFEKLEMEEFAKLKEQLKYHPRLTVETVQQELETLIAKQMAREWAQDHIQEAKRALDLAAGDPDKFKRELNKLVPQLKLIYGPSDDKKKEYHDKFSINEAKEFATLKEDYQKERDKINLFEGRESPERKLKEEDFPRLFFDGTLPFSATAKYRAMPWPPEVQPDNTRDVDALPQLRRNVGADQIQRLKKHILESDPGKKTPALKLYQTADRPILFWRTGEIMATRPADYKKLVLDIDRLAADRAAVEADLKKTPTDAELQDKLSRLKKEQKDLTHIMELVSTGFKFDRARKELALLKAEEIAKRLLNVDVKVALDAMNAEANKLPQTDVITLANLSLLAPEAVALPSPDPNEIPISRQDYFAPSMPKDKVFFPRDVILKDFPKDKIVFPRDDMMKSLVDLTQLKGPIRTGNAELDDVNKKLFEAAKDKKRFVQIVPNKPRSVFYVAAVTKAPQATESDARFESVLKNASFLVRNRDLFLDRIQEQEARAYRKSYVDGLRELHKIANEDLEAKKSFDGDRE